MGIELEKQERALLGNTNTDYENVGLDGNFNIQVIAGAMKHCSGAYLESVQKKENKNKEMTEQNAFICNNHHHWIGIRKIHGKWYNLNSKNSDGPQLISEFYLSAFISGIEENGYNIFVIKGDLPLQDPSFFQGSLRENQKYYTVDQIQDINNARKKEGTNQMNLGGYDQRDLQKMLSKHQKEMNGDKQDSSKGEKKEAEFFAGKGTTMGGSEKNQVQYDPS